MLSSKIIPQAPAVVQPATPTSREELLHRFAAQLSEEHAKLNEKGAKLGRLSADQLECIHACGRIPLWQGIRSMSPELLYKSAWAAKKLIAEVGIEQVRMAMFHLSRGLLVEQLGICNLPHLYYLWDVLVDAVERGQAGGRE